MTRSTRCAGSFPDADIQKCVHNCIFCRRSKHRGGGALRIDSAFLCISPKEIRFRREFYSKRGVDICAKKVNNMHIL